MSSFWDRVDKINEKKKAEEEEEKKKTQDSSSTSFWDRVDKVNSGDIKINTSMSVEDVTKWANGASSVGQRAYNFLKTDGYKIDDKYESEINSYLDQADYVAQYLRANRKSIANYDELISSHYDTVNYLKSLRDGIGKSNEYYSKWNTDELVEKHGSAEEAYKYDERAYGYSKKHEGKTSAEIQYLIDTMEDGEEKDWLTSYKSFVYDDEMAVYDIEAGEKELERLDKRLKQIHSSMPYEDDEYFSQYASAASEVQEQIKMVKQYINYAKRIQEGIRLSSVADPNSGNYDPDFAKYSSYKSTEESYLFGLGKRWDFDYEVINGNEEATDDYIKAYGFSSSVLTRKDAQETLKYRDHMTAEQKALYNYYYNKHGKEAAQKYLDSIEKEVNEKRGFEKFKSLEDKTALELLFSIEAGLDQFNSGIKNLFNGDDYIPATETQVASSLVREDLKDVDLKWYNFKEGEWDDAKILGSSLGQGIYDIGTTTANMAPSILASTAVGLINPAAGSWVGTTLMGASAAGNAYADALNRGFDKSQAATYGLAIGVSEALLEKAIGGIGALGGTGTKIAKAVSGIDSAILRFAANYGGRIASEALEEGLQEILDPIFQNAILGTDENVDWESVAYSALLGGLSAGNFELVGTIIQTSVEESIKKEYGGKVESLIQEGLESDINTESYKLAADYMERGRTLTGAEIRNLLEANQEQITPKDLKKIQKAAEARLTELGQTEDVQKLAELATKYATGQKLSKAEKAFLANNKNGNRVAQELLPENIMSGEYTSEWAEGIGTKQVNKLAYNIKNIVEQMASFDNPATYKSLSDRIGENETVNVSDNGKATISGTDEEISIDKKVEIVDFVKDKKTGKITDIIINANGKQVKASEIDFADADQAYLFSAVKHIENITPADATAFVRGYDPSLGISVGEYLNGVDEAYTYGYHGYTEADMKSGLFTTKLSDEKAKGAYELGKLAKKNNKDAKVEAIKRMRTAVEAETEKTVAEGKPAPEPKKMAITYNEGNGVVREFDNEAIERLPDNKRAGVEVARILHKLGLGTNFEFFESFKSKKLKVKDKKTGKLVPARVFINEAGVEEIAPAGVYMKSDGTIRVDLNAYNGRGLTLYALAHELTHFIEQWSPEKYEILAEYLVSTYYKTGITMHQRVLREQARLTEIRKREISYNEAYHEVVANAMMKMFDDGNLVQRLTELKAKDKDLAMKLWEGFKDIFNKLLEFLGVYQKDPGVFRDTIDLMKMKEDFEVLQGMFAEALVDASENFQANLSAVEVGVEPVAVEDVSQFSYSSLAEAAGFEAVMNDDGTRSFTREGKKVSKVTIEDIENSPIGAFINFSLEMGDISKTDADRQKKMFADICTMACKTNDFAMTMQFVGSAVFTGMKANADKQYGTTYDFPSICTKTQAVIDAMSAKMVSLGRGLTTDEIVQLYDDVFASGNPVPCPECYVFSRWIGIGGLLDNIKKYQDYYGDMDVKDVADAYLKMKAEVSQFAEEHGISFGKAKGAMTSKFTKEFNNLTEKIEKAENQGEKVKPADRQRLAELEPMMNTVKAMTWLENVYFADSSLKKVNPNFRVPNSVLFDLNNGEAFATKYKEAWAFRTTQGAGYGKAITPYAEARLGEGVLVTNNTTNAIKGKARGSLDNYFLKQMGKLDKNSRAALKKARLKQLIQAFIGGQRFQSTSDARYENASDYLLAALEMQAMRGMVQAYTKVDGAVPAFSAWGFSINQSLMPLNGGLDANGNVKDTSVGGMKPDVAFENRKKHESAGTITIGVNDNHIRAMFKQWVRDFIIPYHASGGKADVVAEFRRIQEGKEAKGKAVRSTDYSRTQSDKVLSDDVLSWQGKTDAQIQRIHEIRNARIAILTGGKPNMTVVRSNRFLSALYDKLNGGEWDGVKLAKSKVESQIFPNEFWDQTVTYDESAKITKDYLEYCEDLGFLHRFSGMIPSNGKLVPVNGYNENGERVQLTDLAYKYDENGNKTAEVEEFFWKVLTDRRMYDNNGNYLAQKVVILNDTTTDTVTGFAKNNQGREYDKAKAEALAKKIVGEQYSSQETDLDTETDSAYDGGKKKTEQEDMTNETREESGEAFDRRTSQELFRVSQKGQLRYAYRPYLGTAISERAKGAEKELKKLRIPVYIYEKLETNSEGITTNHEKDDSAAIPSVGVFIPFNAVLDSKEIVGHEAFHFLADSEHRTNYVSVLVDNIDFPSAGFISYYNNLKKRYFKKDVAAESKEDDKISDKKKSNTLSEEIFAYITGDVHNGDPKGEVHKFLRDYDAVKAAWDDLLKKQTAGKSELFSSQETDADNAPTFYSQMGKVVEGMKQDKFGASSVISMLRGRGVKAEEIRWSGIQAFLDGKKSVTKAELLEFINSSMLQIEEEKRVANEPRDEFVREWQRLVDYYAEEEEIQTGLDSIEATMQPYLENMVEEGDLNQAEADHLLDLAYKAVNSKDLPAKWDKYRLSGGENYREILFKLPDSAYINKAMKGHWGDDAQGVLAHARIQDFNTFIGKMLFIEEIQSDWHNAGQRYGYGTGMTEAEKDAERVKIREEFMSSDIGKSIIKRVEQQRASDSLQQPFKDVNEVYDWIAFQPLNIGTELMIEYPRWATNERLNALMALDEKISKLNGVELVPDAPFKSNYHEYVLKRLLRMAAEEGYDSIGWTTAEIQSDRWSGEYAEGYRIEYDQDIPKFLKKYGKQWDTTVGKTKLDNGTEVWSMAITDAMQKSVLKDGQALYSTQETDNISNRDMLANAFETLAQNSEEYKMIQDYKNHIRLLNEYEEKLSKLNAEIREITFGKEGERDYKRLRELQAKAKEMAGHINRHDKKLIEMEASAPLRKVIEQERKKEAQKTREHIGEILQNKKESAQRSELRYKIQNFKKKMESKLLKPTDRQYVPVDLIGAMIEVCNLIDTDTSLYKADGSLNKSQVKRDETKEKLQNLKDEYEKLKTNSDPMYAGEFDEMVYTYLTELRDNYSGKSLKEMSLDELAEMYEILRGIDETLADARKLIGWGDAESVYEAGDSIVAEQNAITQKRKHGKRNAAQKGFDKIDNLGLSPVRNVERMSGYNQDSALLKLFKKFEQGIRKKNFFVMNAYKSFEKLTSGKEYDNAVYKEVGGKKYTDVNGRKFGLSKMQMMQAILSYERETANKMSHISGSGFSFADLDMLRKGKLKDAISEEYSHRVPAAIEMVAEFMEILKDDKWCQDYMVAARKFFNETAKNAINETSISLKHRIIAKDKNYIPFEVDKNFVVREISAENDIQETINAYGMLKDTKKGAAQPLIITGLNNILDRHIDQVGNVYGLAIEVRNFNKVWNVKSTDGAGDNPTVKTVIQRNWGVEGVKHIEQAVQDIQGPRVRERNALYDKVKSGYIGATFLLNLSVVTKQNGSLFSATSMIKWRDPGRMLANLYWTMLNSKKISAEVDKYTATAWMRRQGMSDAELYTLMTQAKKPGLFRALDKAPAVINPIKWITARDHAVALSLWKYCKQDTAERTGLNGEELLKATAEFYNEVIENTQSMTDVLHRPEIQKKGDVISEAFGMFKTDLYQMAGQLQATAGRFMADKSKENGKALARTVYSTTMSALWGSLMTTVFALLRYKVKPYADDEEDELTFESWLKRQGAGLAGDLMGYIFPLFGSEVVGVFENIMYGESDDIVDSLALTAINDLYNAAITIGSSIKDREWPEVSDMRKLAAKALQCFRIPANNILRALDAIQLHAEDIANGEFLSFNAGLSSKTEKIYSAIVRGDMEDQDRLKSTYKDDDAYHNAVRKALRENDPRIKEAALAEIGGNPSERVRIARLIIADGFVQDDVVAAINSEINALTPKEEDSGTDKKKGFYTTENLVREFANGDTTSAKAAKSDIISTAIANGKTKEQAEKDFMSNVSSSAKEAYEKNWLSESKAKKLLMEYAGEDEDGATSKVNYWTLCKMYPKYKDLLTESRTKNYHEFVKPAGISMDMYAQFLTKTKDLADIKDANGKVKLTKQDQVIDVIDALPITRRQKNALFLAAGYKESTLSKVRWS